MDDDEFKEFLNFLRSMKMKPSRQFKASHFIDFDKLSSEQRKTIENSLYYNYSEPSKESGHIILGSLYVTNSCNTRILSWSAILQKRRLGLLNRRKERTTL